MLIGDLEPRDGDAGRMATTIVRPPRVAGFDCNPPLEAPASGITGPP
jgi:hypothetical protein